MLFFVVVLFRNDGEDITSVFFRVVMTGKEFANFKLEYLMAILFEFICKEDDVTVLPFRHYIEFCVWYKK